MILLISCSGRIEIENDYFGEALVAALAVQASKDVWLIDSGASFHMTSHRDWLLK